MVFSSGSQATHTRPHFMYSEGAMEANGHTLAGAFLVERPEIAVTHMAATVEGMDHHANCAQLAHGPRHLIDGGLDVGLQWHDGDGPETLGVGRAPLVDPIVVGPS